MWMLKGRQKIYTDAKEITADNIIKELSKAYEKHKFNRLEMQYLIDFEAGDQPLDRPKIVRPEINIKVTDNAANYITDFKMAYFWGTPAMLIQRSDKDAHKTPADSDDEGISALNEMLTNACDIGYKNQELGNFVEKVGVGYRLVDVKTDFEEDDEALVDIYTLDPRYAFCVYSNDAKQKKLMGVTYRTDNGEQYFTCFTPKMRFEVSKGKIVKKSLNPLKKIAIVEYERSVDRTGCFERQISDCIELNTLVSFMIKMSKIKKRISSSILFENSTRSCFCFFVIPISPKNLLYGMDRIFSISSKPNICAISSPYTFPVIGLVSN